MQPSGWSGPHFQFTHPFPSRPPEMQKKRVEAWSPAGAYVARAASIAASVASVSRCFVATSLPRALAAVMTPTAVSSSRMLPERVR
jgi:hypothetical protein